MLALSKSRWLSVYIDISIHVLVDYIGVNIITHGYVFVFPCMCIPAYLYINTVKGYPVIDGVINMERVSFARFFETNCNYNMVAIANNPLSPDAVHPIHMTSTNKLNVDLDHLAFFYEPDPDWIVQEVSIFYSIDIVVHMQAHHQSCIIIAFINNRENDKGIIVKLVW